MHKEGVACLLSEERQKRIIELLEHHESYRISDLVKELNVSRETVRRDIQELQKKDILKKVHGGIVLKRRGIEPSFTMRETIYLREKKAIAKQAAKLVRSGDTVFIDVGTTNIEVARQLQNLSHITVITNSVKAALYLIEEKTITVYLVGGLLRNGDLSLSGRLTRYALEQFNVDKAFIGVAGITLEDGYTDYHVEEVEVRRIMIQRSKQPIIVADHSKFGVTAFCNVAPIDPSHQIITDSLADQATLVEIQKKGAEVIIAPLEESSTDR